MDPTAILLRQLAIYHPRGEGSPEGVKDGPLGAVFVRTDGAVGSLLYVKTTALGDKTGWDVLH